MMVELGFCEAPRKRPEGVCSCSSFTWAQDMYRVIAAIRGNPFLRIIDEYGRFYSGHKFLELIKNNCPISFEHMIGIEFS